MFDLSKIQLKLGMHIARAFVVYPELLAVFLGTCMISCKIIHKCTLTFSSSDIKEMKSSTKHSLVFIIW